MRALRNYLANPAFVQRPRTSSRAAGRVAAGAYKEASPDIGSGVSEIIWMRLPHVSSKTAMTALPMSVGG